MKHMLTLLAAATPVPAVTERVDLFAKAGGANRLVELVYPVTLPEPGVAEVRLVPVTGKAVVSGAVLETVNQYNLYGITMPKCSRSRAVSCSCVGK